MSLDNEPDQKFKELDIVSPLGYAGVPFRLVCNTRSTCKPNFALPVIIAKKLYTKHFL